MSETYLFFVFLGSERPWKPLAGLKAPSPTVHEVRSLPGGLYAAGESRSAAVKNLQAVVDCAVETSGKDFKAWYLDALKSLTRGELEVLREAALNAMLGSKEASVRRHDGSCSKVVEVDEAELCAS